MEFQLDCGTTISSNSHMNLTPLIEVEVDNLIKSLTIDI